MNNESIDMNKYYDEQKDKLETLREIEKLNPINFLRVAKARMEAEKLRELYIKENPSDIIETDFSVAEDLEYELLFNQLRRRVTKDWKDYIKLEQDGFGLDEYIEEVINSYKNNKTR